MVKVHDCYINSHHERKRESFFVRLSDAYQQKIQDFSQKLFINGWVLTSFLFPALFGEPIESVKSGIRRLIGWKKTWHKYGFYDAGDPKSLEKLEKDLRTHPSKLVPIICLHGFASTPDIWVPWAQKLNEAEKNQKIGHVITLQLPNDLTKRMEVVFKAINDVSKIYERANGLKQVDIIGHSQGGYAGHLAAFKEIKIKDELGVDRRWHNTERNDTIRKVISIGASTWLCCMGQHDETTTLDPKKEDIYPLKAVIVKDVNSAYTHEQIETIQKTHSGIYDFIGTQDAVSPIISPLPNTQVYLFKHGHIGVATCLKVYEKAIEILAS